MINIDKENVLTSTGVWATYEGSEFLVAHTSHLPFQRAVMRRQQPHRKKIENGTLDPETLRDLMCQSMAEALILDWKKVTDGEGKEVPYSPASGYKALKNNPDLRDFISEFSMNLENFRQLEKEALGKD